MATESFSFVYGYPVSFRSELVCMLAGSAGALAFTALGVAGESGPVSFYVEIFRQGDSFVGAASVAFRGFC